MSTTSKHYERMVHAWETGTRVSFILHDGTKRVLCEVRGWTYSDGFDVRCQGGESMQIHKSQLLAVVLSDARSSDEV
jgi:hypothetical protein